jgi:hypothetical protein
VFWGPAGPLQNSLEPDWAKKSQLGPLTTGYYNDTGNRWAEDSFVTLQFTVPL